MSATAHGIDLPAGTSFVAWVWPRRDRDCPRCGGRLGPLSGEVSPGVRGRRCTECGTLAPAVAIGVVVVDDLGDERVVPVD